MRHPDAAALLTRALRVLTRHEPTLGPWSVLPAADGLRVDLAVGGRPVPLLVSARRGPDAAWATTASLALSFAGAPPEGGYPEDVERLLGRLLTLLRHGDPGGLEVPRPEGNDVRAATARPAPDARADLAPELHRASFLAWNIVQGEDLYPHVTPLGDLVDDAEIHAGWDDTAARMRAGRAPEKLGLYVHVPFCTVACTYCYCAKTDRFRKADVDAYVEGLIADAARFGAHLDGIPFTSVYVGGGTPSLLPAPAIRRLFAALHDTFDVPGGTHVVVEGNPDSLDEAKIAAFATAARVTRLTIGVQTLDDEVQRIVRRFNRPEQVAAAIAAARTHGVPHVNCDLMAGLPGQTLASFQRDLDFLLSLGPDSIHLNAFRPLARVRAARDVRPADPAWIALRDAMVRWGEARLAEVGHADQLGQGRHRTRNAANIQEYDLRRQNSSLVGLGFPARSHSFANHYYVPAVDAGFDAALGEHVGGSRRWRAIRVDEHEEAHKFLVTHVRRGFRVAEFRHLFGLSPLDVAGGGMRALAHLGVWEWDEEEVRARVDDNVDALVLRTLLYSPAQTERAWAAWGGAYDASEDYEGALRRLVEA